MSLDADAASCDVPTQYAPYGGISDTTFYWSTSSGATSYSIWICDSNYNGVFSQSYSTSDVESGGMCSAYINPGYFLSGTLYYWFVCASNNTGDSWSWDNGGMVFWLDTGTAALPTVPTQHSPSGETNSTTFAWSASSGATSYSIWICDSTFNGVFSTSYAASDVENSGICYATVDSSYFSPGVLYYWYICASNSSGDAWSWDLGGMTFWFASTVTVPEVPIPYSPSGITSGITFTWSASYGATNYSIWICDSEFTGVYYQTYEASEVESSGTCSTSIDESTVA